MRRKRAVCAVLIALLLPLLLAQSAAADAADLLPSVSVDIGGETTDSLKVLLVLTVLVLAPSILIMLTSFTRIVIVFSFVRNALGLQQTPPNQVLIGLALFLSLFIMSPVVDEIKTEAYVPYDSGQITQSEAIGRAEGPLREFMLKQTRNEDLKLFLDLSQEPEPESLDALDMRAIIPAFITSELRRAFIMGFLIFLPFLIIDMVVASVLMSMGMMMLPPSMISLPLKIMLFVLVDGWDLVVKSLILSFN